MNRNEIKLALEFSSLLTDYFQHVMLTGSIALQEYYKIDLKRDSVDLDLILPNEWINSPFNDYLDRSLERTHFKVSLWDRDVDEYAITESGIYVMNGRLKYSKSIEYWKDNIIIPIHFIIIPYLQYKHQLHKRLENGLDLASVYSIAVAKILQLKYSSSQYNIVKGSLDLHKIVNWKSMNPDLFTK